MVKIEISSTFSSNFSVPKLVIMGISGWQHTGWIQDIKLLDLYLLILNKKCFWQFVLIGEGTREHVCVNICVRSCMIRLTRLIVGGDEYWQMFCYLNMLWHTQSMVFGVVIFTGGASLCLCLVHSQIRTNFLNCPDPSQFLSVKHFF